MLPLCAGLHVVSVVSRMKSKKQSEQLRLSRGLHHPLPGILSYPILSGYIAIVISIDNSEILKKQSWRQKTLTVVQTTQELCVWVICVFLQVFSPFFWHKRSGNLLNPRPQQLWVLPSQRCHGDAVRDPKHDPTENGEWRVKICETSTKALTKLGEKEH